MTRFSVKNRVNDMGGANLTVAVADPGSLGRLSSLAKHHFESALLCLETTDRLLRRRMLPRGGRMVRLAQRYFLTDDPMDPQDLAKIQIVVTKIWNGLKSDTLLKIGDPIGSKYAPPDPNKMGAAVQRMNFPDKPKPYDNSITTIDGSKVTYKAIQLNSRSLGHRGYGTQNLLHEASHKFAGTRDNGYIAWGGAAGPAGLNDKKLALENADSYGYFIVSFPENNFDWTKTI
jgi:hypothetical protein